MKKILLTSSFLFFVAIASILSLTSCEKYKEIFHFDEDSDVKKYEIRIVVSIHPDNTPWRNSVLNWAWKAREELEQEKAGVSVDLILARDEYDQAEQLHSLLKKGHINALVIMADKPEIVASYCRDFRRKGTMVIAVYNNIVFPQCPNVLLTGDNEKIGSESALAIAKVLGGKDEPRGTILAFTDFNNPAINARFTSFRDVLTQYMKLNVKEVNYKTYGNTPYEAMTEYLKTGEKFDVVWTGWDAILEDIIRACDSAGASENIVAFVGGNGSNNINRMMLQEESKVPVNMTYSPKMMYEAIMLAFEKSSNLESSENTLSVPEIIVNPTEIITKDNVKKFINSSESF